MALELPNTYQRLPVYVLIDTSASMAGAPITAVNEGLRIFQSTLQRDEQCRESAHVSVIRFSSDAEQVLALTEADRFAPPVLTAGGSTALSKGLDALGAAIRRELRPKSADSPGDYKPLVFLLTDGHPNDDDPWRDAARRLFEQKGRRPSALVAIGAGPSADAAMLRELAPEHTFMLADLDATKLRGLFQWMANSTVIASKSPGAGAGGLTLAPAPPNLFGQGN